MRLNAPLPAFLALAVLSLLPATLLAKSAHRHPHKAQATTSAPKRSAHKKAATAAPARDIRNARRRNAAKPSLSRVKSQPATIRHHPRHAKSAAAKAEPQERNASTTPPHKATSADFLKAATTAPEAPQADPASIEIHNAPRHAEARETGPRSPSRSRKTAPAAKPVPVIAVIRPTAEKPQLESVSQAASTPVILPTLYNKRGRLIVPPPLRGSHEILLHQNQVADRDGLDRIRDDDDLLDMRSHRMLVSLPLSTGLQVDERLPSNRRYCRPWTAQFLEQLARAHYAHFHTPLQVNSAVRTVEFQQHLLRINGNAAPAGGDTASPHLTGQAIDLAKHGLSLTEIAWLRGYLLPLVQQGKVDVEEEFQQACFHISVYKRYLPPAPVPRRSIASSHRSETTSLAASIQ